VVWRQDDVTHPRFYWLSVDEANRKAGTEIIASRKGQTIEIHKAEGVEEVTILLNSKLVNLDDPIKIIAGGKTIFEGKAQSTIAQLAQSLEQRADPGLLFSAAVKVKLEKKSI
jgi:hypothetical protein